MSANSPTLFETLGCLPSTLSPPPSGLINEWVTDLASAETEGNHHLRQWNPVVDSYINMFPPWFRFYYRTRPLATSRDDATRSLPNVDDNVSISAKQEKIQMQTFGYFDSRWLNGFNNLPLTGGTCRWHRSFIHPDIIGCQATTTEWATDSGAQCAWISPDVHTYTWHTTI